MKEFCNIWIFMVEIRSEWGAAAELLLSWSEMRKTDFIVGVFSARCRYSRFYFTVLFIIRRRYFSHVQAFVWQAVSI